MQVELNNEAVDGLVKSILTQDYYGLVEDTERLKKLKNKSDAQLRDLENNRRYLEAIETALEYYVGPNWKEQI
jgi:nitrogen fixation/metabolism regulation signal transduction histidine kinase